MIIIGNGRVGGALNRRANAAGEPSTVISRSSGWDILESPDAHGPILVTTNAGDLEQVIAQVPSCRHKELAFTQNGMIDDVLRKHGLEGNTRGLLYFAVPKRGADISPGGASIFTGPYADSVTDWFQQVDLDANEVQKEHFRNEMFSKLIWNCVFGLMCDVYDCTVGELVGSRRSMIDELVAELSQVANFRGNATLNASETSDSLCEYSMSIPGYQGALKQWEWRNGWFVQATVNLEEETPRHHELLLSHHKKPLHRQQHP